MTPPSGDAIEDRLAIRQLVENWILWRDSGEWDRFATIWHSRGWMVTTWSEAEARTFIAQSRDRWQAGVRVLHTIGGMTIDIQLSRAIAQTKMQIIQRAVVHDVLVDVTCHGRFWDAFEKEDGQWKLLFRQPIYELDRMLPVSAGCLPRLDETLLRAFPEGYRHLAYLQTTLGMSVSRSMPGMRGPEIESLLDRGNSWLAGGPRSLLSPVFARDLDASVP